VRIYGLFLALFLSASSYAQNIDTKRISAELVAKVYSLPEINKDMFKNARHSANCVFVIVNEVIERDSLKIQISSAQYDIADVKVLYYPRKSIAGYDITYWFQVDEISIEQKGASIRFKTIYSKDNWLEEYDQVHVDGKLEFELMPNGEWRIKRRKIKEYKIER
jgi:hypothetical protein